MPIALQMQKISKGYYTPGIKEPHWILKDIDLDISQGDIIGVLGFNGAGKSTLLRILSKITVPTAGQIIGYGKVISLLETGTFFHPELNGTENIYLNGAMLGGSRMTIKSKLDDIIDFAGLSSATNLQLKKYSSGMQLRLAFSIAAHLEPDILIMDEILAVSDADFRLKCLKKLKSLNIECGTTILFVSHQINDLNAICSHGFILHEGRTNGINEITSTIHDYEKLRKE